MRAADGVSNDTVQPVGGVTLRLIIGYNLVRGFGIGDSDTDMPVREGRGTVLPPSCCLGCWCEGRVESLFASAPLS